MLVDEDMIMIPNPILSLVSSVGGRETKTKRIREGIYEIGHFGSSNFLRGYEDYPELSIESYGVCDNLEQILEQCPELSCEVRQFVITMTLLEKSAEPAEGGWRWHKWGPYIGIHEPQCEYLYDEPVIERVYVYHIYEKENK